MLRGRQKKGQQAKKLRDAQETRARILRAAFQEIYRSGYQSADIESVLEVAALTKGALYYHFSNKEALGLEMVDELIGKIMLEKWLRPLESANDPIATLIEVLRSASLEPRAVEGGCPLNNLAQEMSGISESFPKRLTNIFSRWIEGIGESLRISNRCA
jgi:TetR/AcrR family transcriptional repressor of nem operon